MGSYVRGYFENHVMKCTAMKQETAASDLTGSDTEGLVEVPFEQNYKVYFGVWLIETTLLFGIKWEILKKKQEHMYSRTFMVLVTWMQETHSLFRIC